VPKPRRRKLPPNDPHFIQGIHNYCDRWCARCEFSHRCFNYSLMSEGDEDPQPRDINNQKFWEKLNTHFKKSKKLVEASVAGKVSKLSLDAAEALEKHQDREARARGMQEMKGAMTYAGMVDEWFNNELQIPLHHIRDLEKKVREGSVSVATAKGDLVRLNECVEVIRWYQHFIYVKLCRAFSSQVEEEGHPDWKNDSDGSAKIALIAIERSLAAWGALRDMFPQQTDSILEVLIRLDRLLHSVEAKFPKTDKFIRPGFDEAESRLDA
jgi:hypothetical protein